MPPLNPAFYVITGAVALGVALYALFSQPARYKPVSYSNEQQSNHNRSTPSAFYREECSICKDLLSFPTLALECGHVFHSECIRQAVRMCSKTCPNCRSPIPRSMRL